MTITGDESHVDPKAQLTHLNDRDEAHMVDVGAKEVTKREAIASTCVRTRPDVIAMISSGSIPKGDVAAVARVAGIMAAKRTSDLIPLCHPLALDAVDIAIELQSDAIAIRATVRNTGRTGVEMEAMTAASVAALTVYDMCKAVDRAMVIEHVQLEEKSGGKSGHFIRTPTI